MKSLINIEKVNKKWNKSTKTTVKKYPANDIIVSIPCVEKVFARMQNTAIGVNDIINFTSSLITSLKL